MTAVLSELRAPEHVDDGYSAFYRRYHRPLTCYLRMNFRSADTEAIAQEAFCRALSHWAQVGQMANAWPWLVVTARNLARNNIRDEKASQAAGLQVFHPSACSPADVAEQVEAFDQLRRLARAMSVLTPLQRQLLIVMVEEGLTGAQVARRLGMTPGAVRMHLSRMRSRLGDRFVSLGGQLAIGPLVVIRGLTWHPRRSAAAVPAGALLAAGALITAVVVGPAPAAPSTPAPPVRQAVLVIDAAPPQVPIRDAGVTRRTQGRPTASLPAAADAPARHAVVIATGEVIVADRVRTRGAAVERRGEPETPAEIVDRCLRHVTVRPDYIACDG